MEELLRKLKKAGFSKEPTLPNLVKAFEVRFRSLRKESANMMEISKDLDKKKWEVWAEGVDSFITSEIGNSPEEAAAKMLLRLLTKPYLKDV